MDEKPIEVTVHGRIGSGPVDVRTLDAFCEMIRCAQQMIDEGAFDDERIHAQRRVRQMGQEMRRERSES